MIPSWLANVALSAESQPLMSRPSPHSQDVRSAAVLILFGGGAGESRPADADVLLTQRASTLRQHSGQVAFPGGATDPGDDGPVGTALREAVEETGLDPSGVVPVATLDPIFVPPSGFDVTPVVAFWHAPSPVGVVDVGETERVARVAVADLLDPSNRFIVRHPLGYQGPAFAVDEMLVWGFTAGILSGLFDAFGWTEGWNHADVRDLDASIADVSSSSAAQSARIGFQ